MNSKTHGIYFKLEFHCFKIFFSTIWYSINMVIKSLFLGRKKVLSKIFIFQFTQAMNFSELTFKTGISQKFKYFFIDFEPLKIGIKLEKPKKYSWIDFTFRCVKESVHLWYSVNQTLLKKPIFHIHYKIFII